jgi:hypothetical protein
MGNPMASQEGSSVADAILRMSVPIIALAEKFIMILSSV